GYRLVPLGGTSTMLADPASSASRRAGYARPTLWGTRSADAGRPPPGPYPYQQADPVGLPPWGDADRPLVGEAGGLWYRLGPPPFVRPEEWPIMPGARAGFRLEPVGFFDRNPTLDVPAPAHCAPKL